MSNAWDERYKHERYFYGTEPNALVAEALADLPVGRGFYPAEGEGRNAVHAAVLGHVVTAVDSSEEGRRKALALAAERGAPLRYLLAGVESIHWDEFGPFDHAVLCFFHPDPELRHEIHARVAASLVRGGALIYVGFAKEQLGRGSGGPPSAELLHDLDEVRREFPQVEWSRAEKLEVDLDEGEGHRGPATVNLLIGRRR